MVLVIAIPHIGTNNEYIIGYNELRLLRSEIGRPSYFVIYGVCLYIYLSFIWTGKTPTTVYRVWTFHTCSKWLGM